MLFSAGLAKAADALFKKARLIPGFAILFTGKIV
jgi:hypothetical protein